MTEDFFLKILELVLSLILVFSGLILVQKSSEEKLARQKKYSLAYFSGFTILIIILIVHYG